MSQEKKPPEKIKKKPKETDHEKTVVDLDIRKLDKDFEETVIVHASVEEDSDLHYFEDEERTGKILSDEPRNESSDEVSEIPLESESGPAKTSFFEKIKRGGRGKKEFSLLYFVFLSLIILLQGESLIELFHQGVNWVWIMIVAMLSTVGIWLATFKRRIESRTGLLWGLVFFTIGISYAAIRFLNSDPQTLHFLKIPLKDFLAPYFILLIFIFAYFIFRTQKNHLIPKLLVTLALFLMLFSGGLALWSGVPLEGNLLGPSWAIQWPIYLRPTVLALLTCFPMAGLATLLLILKPESRQILKSILIPLLIIAVLGKFISAEMLVRQGITVPIYSFLFKKQIYGSTTLETGENPVSLSLRGNDGSMGRSNSLFLEMYATRPEIKGKENLVKLMVKNQEGRGWLGDLKNKINLRKEVTDLPNEISLKKSNLGTERNLAILVEAPSINNDPLKTSFKVSIIRLLDNLSEQQHLFLMGNNQSIGPIEKSKKVDENSLKKIISQTSTLPSDWQKALQQFQKLKGAKHFIVMIDSANEVYLSQRAKFEAEAKKVGGTVGWVRLRGEASDQQDYGVPDPSALSHSLLSASAALLGDFELSYPSAFSPETDISEKEKNPKEKKGLLFVKPLDKDSVSEVINIFLSDDGVDPNKVLKAVELMVDGIKVGQASTRPFVIPWDTTLVPNGPHLLQGIQTFEDGSYQTTQIQVEVQQNIPKIEILHPRSGEYLPNLSEIEVQIGGGLFEDVQKVDFLVNGEWIGEALQPPFRLLWPNDSFSSDQVLIQVRAYLNSQHIISDVVQVQLGYGNLAIQADPNLSSSGQLFPQNVEMILDGSIRMNESMNAWVKWDLVRGGLKKIKEFVPEGTQIGLRLFGTESMVQQDNCGDSKKLKTIFGKLNELKAQGKSPLAFALKRLFEDGKKVKISKVGILLLSDWDNCGLDPLDYLRKSSKESSNVRLHVIYFGDVSPTKETLIKNIAAKMGGKAFKVFNMNDLEAALKETLQVQAVLLDYKNATILQTPLDVKTHRVRSGEYHLLVDSYPPPRLKKIIIPTEGTKTIFLKQIEGGYELEEK